jgi:hypothetical protein
VRNALHARRDEQDELLRLLKELPGEDPALVERSRRLLARKPPGGARRWKLTVGAGALAGVALAAAALWIIRPAPREWRGPEAPVAESSAETQPAEPRSPEARRARSPGPPRPLRAPLAGIEVEASGGLDGSSARAALRGHAAQVTACADGAGAGADATVVADRFGRPTSFVPSDDRPASRAFARCLARKLAGLTLPPVEGTRAAGGGPEDATRVRLRVE